MQIISIVLSAAATASTVSAILASTIYYITDSQTCTSFTEVGATQPAGNICLYIQLPSLNMTFNAFNNYYLLKSYTWIGTASSTPPAAGTALSADYPIQSYGGAGYMMLNVMYPYAAVEHIIAPTDTCLQNFKAVSYVDFGVKAVYSSTGKLISKARNVTLTNTETFTVQCAAIQPPPTVF